MRRMLQRKLQSQRGASLLLALLLLLICSMVGASILMAAASNAGKHRSNLEEHQTYLALSSAVSLLCDELNAAQYTGQYRYWVEEHTDFETGDTSYSYHCLLYTSMSNMRTAVMGSAAATSAICRKIIW